MEQASVGVRLAGGNSAALETAADASAFLKVPEKTLAVWRSTNRVVLPYCKIGSAVRYRRADLERFVEQRMRNVTAVSA